jgi:hypothetical protein
MEWASSHGETSIEIEQLSPLVPGGILEEVRFECLTCGRLVGSKSLLIYDKNRHRSSWR